MSYPSGLDHKVPIKVKGGFCECLPLSNTLRRLASRCRHVSRKRRASAWSDFEIMTAWLASDRQPDRLHHGGIPRVGTQDALEINRVGLPRQGCSTPEAVTRTRLQSSQKLWVKGVMKPILPPVSATRT